jgi:phage shock protein A
MAQESETKEAPEPETKKPEGDGSKDLFTRLAEVGEDAIHRIAEIPSRVTKLSESVSGLRTRVDDLQRRVRGLDELKRRVTELEQRVDELSAKSASRRRSTRASTSKETGSSG